MTPPSPCTAGASQPSRAPVPHLVHGVVGALVVPARELVDTALEVGGLTDGRCRSSPTSSSIRRTPCR